MAELGGIPGTVGGGVLMNAGAYGAELAQVVTQVEGVSLSDGRRVIYPADRLDFSYRHSALMDADVVVTQATLCARRRATPRPSARGWRNAPRRGGKSSR